MKYSLRSLFVVVTFFCVVVGGRIEYLRRMAAWHQQEARRLDLKIIETLVREVEEREKTDKMDAPKMMTFRSDTRGNDARAARYHEAMVMQFRKGLLRPWYPVPLPDGIDLPHSQWASEEVADGR